MSDLARIEQALAFIPAVDRDTWVKMGMAVKSELGEDGFPIWDHWSQQDTSYDEKAAHDVWKSIRANGKVTGATLFHEAKRYGWRHDGAFPEALTDQERAERDSQRQEALRQAEENRARRNQDAANKTGLLWSHAKPIVPDHPYLLRKQIDPTATLKEIGANQAIMILGYTPKSNGEPLVGRLVVVPVQVGDTFTTVELIDEAGRKSALAGGAKKGGYWSAQSLLEGDGEGLTLLIAEGVATALSSKDATGYLAIAALSAGNLTAVAKAMRERYPAATMIVLADLTKDTGKPNAKAMDATEAVNGLMAIPDFGDDRPEGLTDFNDLAVLRGLDIVKQIIEGATPPLRSDNQLSEVSGVSGVQPNNDAPLDDTPIETDGVSGVSNHARSPIPELTKRPTFRVFESWLKDNGTQYRPGVWFFDKDKDGNPTQTWVCSPLYVEATTHDGQDNHFGRLLRFRNTLGRSREWAMPMEMLRGSGEELRGELLAMGVQIDPTTKVRNLLAMYLQQKPPARQMRCALQVGWCAGSFVLPDTVIGPEASGVIFQSGERGHDEYTKAGTLEGWRTEVSALAIGNPLLMVAVSSSFVGPMLGRCNGEGGGIHFVGDSSTGKTTLIEAACATWGGPNYRRSWRATANGMEGAAALFNDNLLALDEISECDPREVGAIVYALGNGRGKQRAGRSGNARGVTRWRCFVISSGERTIATSMAEGGYRAKAGQSVRLLDIPAARRHGAWDELHGMASPAAFSDAIKRACAIHHGHAGRAFLESLTHDETDFCALLERIKALPKFSKDGTEGQGKRGAGRFAMVALAGEAATQYGLTGWQQGDAIKAAADIFEVWQTTRGRGNNERQQILEGVSDFIERHGDARFSNANVESDVQIRDRAGWWRDTSDGRTYLFTAAGLHEAIKGFDFNRALDVLQEIGVLPPPGADGKRAKFHRIGGRGMKLYSILMNKEEDKHDAC